MRQAATPSKQIKWDTDRFEEIPSPVPDHIEVITIEDVGPEENLREKEIYPVVNQVERTCSPRHYEIAPEDVCLVSQILDEDEDKDERADWDTFLWEVSSKWSH